MGRLHKRAPVFRSTILHIPDGLLDLATSKWFDVRRWKHKRLSLVRSEPGMSLFPSGPFVDL